MRRLLVESDWNQNEYFSLATLSNKKKSDHELQAVKRSDTRDYYEQLNTFITDLEDMASGKCESEEDAEGTLRSSARSRSEHQPVPGTKFISTEPVL